MINEIRNGILAGLKNTTCVRVAIATDVIGVGTYVNTLDASLPEGTGIYVVDEAGSVYIISIEKAKWEK